MRLKTLNDFNFKDKLVLVRLDLNSPIIKGKILNSERFKESAKTINELLKKKAKIVIITHQGRKGGNDFLISLKQHAITLSKYTNKKIDYIDDLFGDLAFEKINTLKPANAILLKNVRYFDDELNLKGSRFYSFSKLFDIYVNDAFSVCHRNHGSIIIPPKVIPSCMGRSLEKEINALRNFSLKNKGKSLFLLGGSKVEDYLPLFNVLRKKENKILASGVLANLILISLGKDLGYENTWIKNKKYNGLISQFKELYMRYPKQIILPMDFAIGKYNYKNEKRREVLLEDAPFKDKIWDVGHITIEKFIKELNNSNFIFMKGPLGYSEFREFSYASVKILKEISKLTKNKKVFSLLGGGHLTTTIKRYKISNSFSHISLSGGALIYYLSGKKLPGIDALITKKR